jgi:ubiquinone/menaquinone biosynthesis C-methylase UbiE
MRLCYCGSSTTKTLFQTPVVLPGGCNLNSEIKVVECSLCGFVFSDTHLSQKDYDEYYASQDMYSEPNKDFSKHVRDIYEFCKEYTGSSVLDIGCGGGQLLRFLKTQGLKVQGIDTSQVCVDELLKDDIPCIRGSLFSVSMKEKYNLVTFVHVLEHVLDLNTCVNQLLKFVDKYLYIEVPDSTRYITNPPFQDFNTEHINHFTTSTLIRLFEKNGMRCVRSWSQKNIQTNYGDYGAICCIFTKETQGLDKYITESNKNLQKIIDSVSKDEPLCLYGAGQFAYKLLAKLPNIKFLVDDMKCRIGKKIHGITITDKVPDGVKVLKTF